MASSVTNIGSGVRYIDAPTLSINVEGTPFVYRDIGPRSGVPLILLNHWGAVLDNFDPRIVDGLASKHRVIATNYRGIGASGGTAPVTIDEMARDAIALIRALGFEKVDLLGFSLGGFVAQDITLKAPDLVRKLILTGTGPAGGEGIDKVWPVSWPLMIKGFLTLRDPKFYLFFTSTANGRQAAAAFLKRLKERKADRDKGPTPGAFLRQVKAITAWGRAGASRSREHSDPGTDREWRQRYHGADRKQHRYGAPYPGRRTGYLRRCRAWRDFPEPRRFRAEGLVLPRRLTPRQYFKLEKTP